MFDSAQRWHASLALKCSRSWPGRQHGERLSTQRKSNEQTGIHKTCLISRPVYQGYRVDGEGSLATRLESWVLSRIFLGKVLRHQIHILEKEFWRHYRSYIEKCGFVDKEINIYCNSLWCCFPNTMDYLARIC